MAHAGVDADEILSYEPERKRVRENGVAPTTGAAPAASTEELLAALEAEGGAEPLDEAAVRKLIASFEKRAVKNAEMRVKFPDEPSKFMESEVELNTAIQELHAIAAMPETYPILNELEGTKQLLQLLSHQNTDIVAAVLSLLQELTDVDVAEDVEPDEQSGGPSAAEGGRALADALCDGQIVPLLVRNMERLDESKRDEADAVHNALAVVENLAEMRADLAHSAADNGLLHWLLRRVKHRTFDGNKLYASEILGVLLQQSEQLRKALGAEGIDILLQSLALYKRRNPEGADERELMENLFDSLCAALIYKDNRQKFLDGEGLQLMNLMLREKKESRMSALKVIDHATSGPEGRANCDKFVEILGLRTIFPLFMKTPGRSHRRSAGRSGEEHEEHVCAIVASMLRSCATHARQRIVAKFQEDDLAKIDRLVELFLKYRTLVARHDAAERRRSERRPADEEDELDADEKYVARLDAGLFTLQLLALILADVYVHAARPARDKTVKLLQMKGSSLNDAVTVLTEYMENLGEEAKTERSRVESLLSKLRS